MQQIKYLLVLLGVIFTSLACNNSNAQKTVNPYYSRSAMHKLNVSDAEWKKILPANVFYIARQEGTDRAYQSRYYNNHTAGTYYCAVCGNPLFSSKTKYESHTGWPSFYAPLKPESVVEKTDADGQRIEVECSRCNSHLGHVFSDGPRPTGLRYCINGTVLDFVPAK